MQETFLSQDDNSNMCEQKAP